MPDLPPLVQSLLHPKAYPMRPERIELVQTQISFLFLAGERVYKIKKPVDFGFLDFTTLEKRRYYCEQEILLNRRLCPDIYLDVVSVIRTDDEFAIQAQGEAVEYAVKMRRLPQDRMMDELLRKGQVSTGMVAKVAKKIAKFHRQAQTIKEGFGGLATARINTEENFMQIQKYIGTTISAEENERIKGYTESFMERNAGLFDKRVREGRVKNCHGDLHTAHICFGDQIYIFDCIEFNDRFRYQDVANEIAFLAMDLDYHGQSGLSNHFVNIYAKLSGDQELMKLLNFYKCYRAYVRGKVESFKLDDPHISGEEKTRVLAIARKYFKLAESYT